MVKLNDMTTNTKLRISDDLHFSFTFCLVLVMIIKVKSTVVIAEITAIHSAPLYVRWRMSTKWALAAPPRPAISRYAKYSADSLITFFIDCCSPQMSMYGCCPPFCLREAIMTFFQALPNTDFDLEVTVCMKYGLRHGFNTFLLLGAEGIAEGQRQV